MNVRQKIIDEIKLAKERVNDPVGLLSELSSADDDSRQILAHILREEKRKYGRLYYQLTRYGKKLKKDRSGDHGIGLSKHLIKTALFLADAFAENEEAALYFENVKPTELVRQPRAMLEGIVEELKRDELNADYDAFEDWLMNDEETDELLIPGL